MRTRYFNLVKNTLNEHFDFIISTINGQPNYFLNGISPLIFCTCIFIHTAITNIAFSVIVFLLIKAHKIPPLYFLCISFTIFLFFILTIYLPFWYKTCFSFSISNSSQKTRFTVFKFILPPVNLRFLRYKYNSFTLKLIIIKLNIVSTASWQ